MNSRPNHAPLEYTNPKRQRGTVLTPGSSLTLRVSMGSSLTLRVSIGGYTLVEMLVALTLTLILMTVVVRVFGSVGEGIRKSRNALEQFDRLRTTAQQLNQDLNEMTAVPDGRAKRVDEAPGYLELIEGSYLFANTSAAPVYYGVNSVTGSADYTVGQRGDILMFTARNASRPFVGRFAGATVQSDVAEIAWFLRGNRLHRRVLLVVPGTAQALASYSPKQNFYNENDLSARLVGNVIVPNSLADLTKRENRFAHDARTFPFDVRGWGTYGLPTLAECSSTSWMTSWTNGSTPPPPTTWPTSVIDMWDNTASGPFSPTSTGNLSDQALATGGSRVADDVVLTNVIGFDVKVWEPAANGGAGGYVDLGSPVNNAQLGAISLASFTMPQGPTVPRFNNGGIIESGLSSNTGVQRVYDTGCFSYENEGIYKFDNNGNPVIVQAGGNSTNGFDDDTSGVVDDRTEQITSPPYPVALRGIQIKIRCFEPDSRQVREITIEHDFLPK